MLYVFSLIFVSRRRSEGKASQPASFRIWSAAGGEFKYEIFRSLLGKVNIGAKRL